MAACLTSSADSLQNGIFAPTSVYEMLMQGGQYLVEAFIVQHPLVSHIYPLSVNTLRLVTIKNHDTVHLVFFSMRIGNGKRVDNLNSEAFPSLSAPGVQISPASMSTMTAIPPLLRLSTRFPLPIRFEAFCKKHSQMVAKPLDGTCGRGVEFIEQSEKSEIVGLYEIPTSATPVSGWV